MAFSSGRRDRIYGMSLTATEPGFTVLDRIGLEGNGSDEQSIFIDGLAMGA
jgi:hypothetical protein